MVALRPKKKRWLQLHKIDNTICEKKTRSVEKDTKVGGLKNDSEGASEKGKEEKQSSKTTE